MVQKIRKAAEFAKPATAWAAALLVLATPATSLAQGQLGDLGNAGSVDPTIDRDRTDRTAPQPTLSTEQAADLPRGELEVSVPQSSDVAGTRLASVRFEGASLPAGQLAMAVREYVGQALTAETVQAIAAAVSAIYADSDIAYYSVMVPPQVPTGGVLLVRVTEGRLVEHRIIDPTPSTPDRLIAAYVENMMGQPLRKSTLDRYLTLIRAIPGQTVQARILQRNTAGELALELEIDRRQVEVQLTIDNSGVSNVLSSPQAQVAVSLNGVVREGDSTRITAYAPFTPDRYQFYSLTHETPIGSDGFTLAGSAAHMRTRTRNGIEGRATLGGITARYPIVRSATRNVVLSASLDGTESTNYFLDTAFGDYQTRVARFGAVISDGDARQAFAVSGVLSRGLDILGARPFTGYSEETFTKLNLSASFAQRIGDDFLVRVNTKGQYSDDLLPVTERFSLGGRGAGMAFRSGTRTADRGIGGSAEVSRPFTLPSGFINRVELFAFADGSHGRSLARPVYNLSATDYSLASAGGGFRLTLADRFSASAEVAIPIDLPTQNDSRSARFLFGIGAKL